MDNKRIKDEDLVGLKFGKLYVIKLLDYRKNGHALYGCICECGNIVRAEKYPLLHGRKKSCGCLKTESAKKATPRKDLTNKKFNRLNVVGYSHTSKKGIAYWNVWCDCEKELPYNQRRIFQISSHRLISGKVGSCGCYRKETASIRNRADISNKKFGHLTAIKDVGVKNGKRLWLCKCDCGNICEKTSRSIISGNTKTCGKCDINGSLGENKIRKILIDNNITFKEQVTFNELWIASKDKKLKFDFMIDNKYIIEYDGEQHFKSVKSWDKNKRQSLKRRQLYDYVKNKYCYKNNIPIIRIPYWYYDKIELKDLLLNQSNEFLFNFVEEDKFEKIIKEEGIDV